MVLIAAGCGVMSSCSKYEFYKAKEAAAKQKIDAINAECTAVQKQLDEAKKTFDERAVFIYQAWSALPESSRKAEFKIEKCVALFAEENQRLLREEANAATRPR
jgi:hypothetical protein